MAIFVPGMECLLCGKPMGPNDDLFMTSPIIGNQSDPLIEFSDAVYHRTCFDAHPLAKRVNDRLAEIAAARREWPPICFICGLKVASPDDYFGFGCLTDDPANPLNRYRFKSTHKSCLERLPDLPELIEALQLGLDSGQWAGPGVDWLLSEIGQALQRRSSGDLSETPDMANL